MKMKRENKIAVIVAVALILIGGVVRSRSSRAQELLAEGIEARTDGKGKRTLEMRGVTAVTANDGRDMSVLHNTTLEKIAISGGVHYEWLVVERHNAKDYSEPKRGFDASYTTIVSDFKPVAKKLPSGKWETTFHSNLPQTNLP